MTVSEVKQTLDLKLEGNNKGYALSPLVLKEAIGEILRRCAPLSYTEETYDDEGIQITTEWFRRSSSTQHLKKIVVPDTLEDDYELPIEEELAMAVVYFICSILAKKDKKIFEDKAKSLISIYETNLIYIEEEEEY